jgi:hypothetical protein
LGAPIVVGERMPERLGVQGVQGVIGEFTAPFEALGHLFIVIR